MSMLLKDHQACEPRSAHWARLVWTVAVSFAVIAGYALAAPGRPGPKPRSDRGTAKRPGPGTNPATGSGCGSKGAPQLAAAPQAAPGSGSPRFAIEETELRLEPVWVGGRYECAFMIRNKGTADLQIKASGG